MRDETSSSPESTFPSGGLPQFPSTRTGPDSQTQTQQSAGRNASSAGEQNWDISRVWYGTHFPDSLQKPLPEHADLHPEPQQMHLDQQHPEFLPES